MAERINVNIRCGKCWGLIKTVIVVKGSRSMQSGSCTCPTCRKTVRYRYNGCATEVIAG